MLNPCRERRKYCHYFIALLYRRYEGKRKEVKKDKHIPHSH